MELAVGVEVDAVPQLVWEVLTEWERQPGWMVDARSVTVVSEARRGTGVTLRVPTSLLGATVVDVMRVTDWQEAERLEVVHLGRIIRGRGAFELSPLPGGRTQLTWREWIDPPLGWVGRLGTEMVVVPFTRRLFARSLDNLVREIERRTAGP